MIKVLRKTYRQKNMEKTKMNKLKQTAKTILIFILCSATCFLSIGCGEDLTFEDEAKQHNLAIIEDDKTKNELFKFCLDYQYTVPGNFLTYNHLWDGVNIKSDEQTTDRETYTFLTEYYAKNNGYLFVYINENEITESIATLKEYEDKMKNNPEYHFSDSEDDEIIDGKYLFAYKRKNKIANNEKIKYLKAETIESAPLSICGYKMVLCAESKNAIVKENVSSGEKLNNEITVYNKVVLRFENGANAPEKYIFNTNEGLLQKKSEEKFSFNGECLEAYPAVFGGFPCAYLPIVGETFSVSRQVEIVSENGQKYAMLPRYEYVGNEESLFGKHTSEFDSAFYKRVSEDSLNCLYDYNAVAEIIKIK